MDRKDFITKSILASAVGAIAPHLLIAANVKQAESTYDKLIKKVGFNHLPNKEYKTMNTVIHKAETRGNANHGWLNSNHTFSFANYHNPERMNFGVLRVLNDDRVQAGMGFGTHPHDNMEIISIPLEGDLEHKDSIGNVAVIKEGDVQVLSAGTGITHSEYNKNKDKEVKFLQIWVFPKEKNVSPRYDQISIRDIEKENKFYQVLSPSKEDQGVWINQDAWFNLGKFSKGSRDQYKIQKPGNGVYVFVLEGDVEINGEQLSLRDGMGIWDAESINLMANSDARVLLMDVPMNL
ncbi:MAG: redox-sensitive bicupin YhaK (pirin superfamily) [Salibacteraceae bacterium]|jgi:redox-sensitive bicupin YhaK (pirin superfamily)|tara:strand:+ start:57 stop:935 length:879 start_codon:yes stop_codon:yes gene_type:complete